MTWLETYKKYKDSELMKEFKDYLYDAGSPDIGHLVYISDIKNIWGYLICFAETKGYIFDFCRYRGEFNVSIHQDVTKKGFAEYYATKTYSFPILFKTQEQAMLWCANKFFEVA